MCSSGHATSSAARAGHEASPATQRLDHDGTRIYGLECGRRSSPSDCLRPVRAACVIRASSAIAAVAPSTQRASPALEREPPTVSTNVLAASAATRSRDTGADAYLTKPLEVPQFLDVVDRLLSTR
jgi:hypothetical protein